MRHPVALQLVAALELDAAGVVRVGPFPRDEGELREVDGFIEFRKNDLLRNQI